MKSRASVGRALDAPIARMPPRKASKAAKPKAAKPHGGASAASGFEASPEALATAARAAGELWWWDAGSRRWRTRDACVSPGVGAKTPLKDTSWTPWHALCDASEAPYFRWFAGAETNACFNACDRHVLDGRGDDVALTALPETITEATPRVNITRRELLGAVATVAARLRDDHGVRAFDRVLFHAPTDVTHCVYMLACQRLGAAYSATAVDAAEDVLVSRIEDLRPMLVVFGAAESTTHAGVAIDCAGKARRAVSAAGDDGRNEMMPPIGLLEAERDFEHLRASCCLDRWAAMSDAEAFAEANARQTALPATTEEATNGVQKKKGKARRSSASCVAAVPVPSDHPLFVSYTSGSTGRPKGIVHGHGGYVSGVLETMRAVFECAAGEGGDGVAGGVLTVGSSGWITGQSYMLMGPLLAACRSVLMLGSPVFPSPLRAFETIEAEGITVFKSGSAVVRQLMTDPANAARLDAIKEKTASRLRVATFCAEPVSAEVHAYAQAHVTNAFINSYWATEHGSVVFSRDVSRTIEDTRFEPDTKTYPLPWVRCAVASETSDVVITAPYPSLALTVFGDAANCGDGVLNAKPPWRGDLAKFAASYWPRGAGGFVQGDVARKHEAAPVPAARARGKNTASATAKHKSSASVPGYTFHGRSDEVINVNGNRVGTEQIERCLWGVRVGGWRVRDCAVVGAPDFVKGDAPVAFVAFRDGSADARPGATKKPKTKKRGVLFAASPDAIDAAAFKSAAAAAVTKELGAYAAPDHVFVVDALPKTITNKTSRKTLQLLLAGEPASDASLARRDALPPIAAMVREWRKTGATTNARLDLATYWDRYTFSHHVVQGRPIVPGAGWLCMLAAETDARKLADVAFMRGVHAADADVRVTKRRKALQATVGDQVVLRAVVAAGAAAPVGVGPTTFGGAADVAGAVGDANASPPDANASARVSKRKRPSPPRGSKAKKPKPDDAAREKKEAAAGVVVTEEATAAQHYRRCGALRLEYSGAYRAVAGVEWSGHVFRAEVKGTHLAAVLDAGLQVACAAVRAATFIPVAVKEFHLAEAPGDWTAGATDACVVHGEIVEQHADVLVADLRYERVAAVPEGTAAKKDASKTRGMETFAAMGRVRFARVEGAKPRLQPEARRPANDAAQHGRAQTLDPKTSLMRLRQLTPEQRVEAVRSVVRATVLDLTDQEVDFDKTTFDNGMHSLNAVELLSRVNETLGTGVTTRLLSADAPMSAFAEAVATHATTYEAPDAGDANALPFPNVDYATLNELVRRRLAGKTVGATPYFFLAKYFAYNWFKKAFQFFRIGGHAFVLNPPRAVDLGVEVSMNRRVEFRDIDMNQHYTVEMIVARSVDGVEQLMARSGLSHVELYYKRNLFAAKIQSTFHKELALGDRYFIKTKITKVTGSLMDIRVAFLDERETLCFEILWTILIVLDSNERVLLDWENVDLMEGKRLRAGPGKSRVEAPATPKKRAKTSEKDERENETRA